MGLNKNGAFLKKNKSKFIAVILVSFVIVSVYLIYNYTINQTINTSRNLYVEGPLIGAVRIASECRQLGGSIIPPLDKHKGGGPICNLSNFDIGIKNEWSSMPIIGTYQYQYRDISDLKISGGTDEKDMIVCYVSKNNCEFK